MSELFPILAGFISGMAIAGAAPKVRTRYGILAAVLLGLTATVVSGEYRISWEYLFIDIPLVALTALCGYALARRILPAVRHRRNQQS